MNTVLFGRGAMIRQVRQTQRLLAALPSSKSLCIITGLHPKRFHEAVPSPDLLFLVSLEEERKGNHNRQKNTDFFLGVCQGLMNPILPQKHRWGPNFIYTPNPPLPENTLLGVGGI